MKAAQAERKLQRERETHLEGEVRTHARTLTHTTVRPFNYFPRRSMLVALFTFQVFLVVTQFL